MVFNFILIVSSCLFFLKSCTSTSSEEQLENKSDVSTNLDLLEGQAHGEISLNQKVVLSGKAMMLLPNMFELMDLNILASKYPITGHRPTEVYTNKEGTINIALNYTQNKAEEKDLPSLKKTMESQFNQPNIEFIQSSLLRINGRQYVQLEFITPASDTRIYNLLQITSLEGRLAMFTFNCTEYLRKDWETTGKEIMRSIEMK